MHLLQCAGLEHDAAGAADAITQRNEEEIEKQSPVKSEENNDSTDRTAVSVLSSDAFTKTLENSEGCGRVLSAPQPVSQVEGNGNLKTMAQCVPVPDPSYNGVCKAYPFYSQEHLCNMPVYISFQSVPTRVHSLGELMTTVVLQAVETRLFLV
jgi:hypothetical protein